jgi:hypothetical protein
VSYVRGIFDAVHGFKGYEWIARMIKKRTGYHIPTGSTGTFINWIPGHT